MKDETTQLRNHIKSLMIKLKGVRNARKRDKIAADRRLDLYIDLMTDAMNTCKTIEQKVKEEYLLFYISEIRNVLGIDADTWITIEERINNEWKQR